MGKRGGSKVQPKPQSTFSPNVTLPPCPWAISCSGIVVRYTSFSARATDMRSGNWFVTLRTRPRISQLHVKTRSGAARCWLRATGARGGAIGVKARGVRERGHVTPTRSQLKKTERGGLDAPQELMLCQKKRNNYTTISVNEKDLKTYYNLKKALQGRLCIAFLTWFYFVSGKHSAVQFCNKNWMDAAFLSFSAWVLKPFFCSHGHC